MKSLQIIAMIVCFTISFQLKGQVAPNEFKICYQTSVRGEMKVIGNHILNRKDQRGGVNAPSDNRGSSAKFNDELDMQYIDIDDDSSTFSSSGASFSFEGQQEAKVLYAGLYWAGMYPYEEGSLKGKRYKVKNSDWKNPQTVKIKIPSRQEYISVTGELIFDDLEDVHFKGINPYVYYADVTHLLLNTSLEGQYVVANIRATRGYMPGGAAAGWVLVLVLESSGSTEKKIVTYDGFSAVNRQSQTISFTGFKTPSSGNFQTKIMGAVLEGDLNMAGDEVVVSVPQTEKTLSLETKTRPKRNFFNSAITENESFVLTRTPASKNTLGFDVFYTEVANENQEIIPNDASSLHLTFTKSADQYYLFLTALQIENQQEESGKKVDEPSQISSEPQNIAQPTEVKIKTQEMISKDTEVGHYVIVGVFSNQRNADKRVKQFKQLGYQPKTFLSKEKNLTYVYIERFDTYEQASQKAQEVKNNTTITDAWILNVKDTQ